MFTHKLTPEEHLKYLRGWATGLNVGDVADHVLLNHEFSLWAGSINNKHHCRNHGLLEHTYEIFSICANLFNLYNEQVDQKVVLLGVIYHDFGKLWDYTYKHFNGVPQEWIKREHNRNIHHISRSAIEWSKAADKYGIDTDLNNKVLHCILSHHGLPEWGSPVFPNSKEAWMIHLADQMSARLDDCERIDLV